MGFDLSEPMLAEARSRSSAVRFVQADASEKFPCDDGECSLVFAVDVVHHLSSLAKFFQESRRTLGPTGHLMIVTDSEETMRERSLTRFFPEILTLEQKRYPEPDRLRAAARAAGLELQDQEHAVGDIPLTDTFIRQLEAKCSSAMRLLPAHVHAAGMDRVRAAQAEGAVWRSHYLVLHYDPVRIATA
jgi:predicted TPR repeat methyltransferase